MKPEKPICQFCEQEITLGNIKTILYPAFNKKEKMIVDEGCYILLRQKYGVEESVNNS
jgi:hypothetical protein